jgi:isoquinoline 1-oxidoreductase beta subunit
MPNPVDSINLSRRHFIVRSGGMAVGIALGVPALVAPGSALAHAAGLRPNQWVSIGVDGIITIVSPASEMGQGTLTAMPLCLAEDLDADWAKVVVVQAESNPKLYGNKLFNGAMATGGSRTMRGYYELMRVAGAQTRQLLLATAGAQWNVPPGELSTRLGVVHHAASKRSIGYGELAAVAIVPPVLQPISHAMLKPAGECRYLGKNVPRLDIPDKVAGKARYGIDMALEGMLYGAVLRPPVQKDKSVSIDDSAAKAIPGYVATVPLPYGIGILATNTWAAFQARDALKVAWAGNAPAKDYSSEAIGQLYRASAADTVRGNAGVEVEKRGEALQNMQRAVRVLKADFGSEHLAHMTMEPMTATARWDGDKIELWAPTQSPSNAMGAVSTVFNVAPENVKVNTTLLGGGLGRKVETDFVLDAAHLAKAAGGRPVKVTWSRADDVRNDKFRPLAGQHLEVGLDQQNNIIAWHHRFAGESVYGRAAPGLFKATGGKDLPFYEGAEHLLYGFEDRLVEFVRHERGIDVGFWRAIGGGYSKFAVETMIDEVAQLRGQDPLAYRIDLLDREPRAQAVLRAAARMAGWGKRRPPGRALGVAYSDMWETHIAQVVELSLNKKTGLITVHKVWAAVDTGMAVLPQNVATQVEGGIVMALSAALKEQVTFKNGEPEQSNFHDYQVLRMYDLPEIAVQVIVTDNRPGGVGECGVPPLAPAIANAVAVLTNKRLRHLPMQPEAVLRALAA